MAASFEALDAVPGFSVPVHRALTEPILLGGAPRSVARRDPLVVEVARRHLRIPGHLSV